MTNIEQQRIIDFLQNEIRKPEMKLQQESDWCKDHNYSVEAMLLHEKSEILRKLGNKLCDHFELGWINYPK